MVPALSEITTKSLRYLFFFAIPPCPTSSQNIVGFHLSSFAFKFIIIMDSLIQGVLKQRINAVQANREYRMEQMGIPYASFLSLGRTSTLPMSQRHLSLSSYPVRSNPVDDEDLPSFDSSLSHQLSYKARAPSKYAKRTTTASRISHTATPISAFTSSSQEQLFNLSRCDQAPQYIFASETQYHRANHRISPSTQYIIAKTLRLCSDEEALCLIDDFLALPMPEHEEFAERQLAELCLRLCNEKNIADISSDPSLLFRNKNILESPCENSKQLENSLTIDRSDKPIITNSGMETISGNRAQALCIDSGSRSSNASLSSSQSSLSSVSEERGPLSTYRQDMTHSNGQVYSKVSSERGICLAPETSSPDTSSTKSTSCWSVSDSPITTSLGTLRKNFTLKKGSWRKSIANAMGIAQFTGKIHPNGAVHTNLDFRPQPLNQSPYDEDDMYSGAFFNTENQYSSYLKTLPSDLEIQSTFPHPNSTVMHSVLGSCPSCMEEGHSMSICHHHEFSPGSHS